MVKAISVLQGLGEENAPAADAQARAEIAAGRGVPHEKVMKWLLKLAKGEKPAKPCA